MNVLTALGTRPHSLLVADVSCPPAVRAGDLAAEGAPAGVGPAPGGVRAAAAGSGAADAEAAAGIQTSSGGQRGASEEAAGGEGQPDEEHHLQVQTPPGWAAQALTTNTPQHNGRGAVSTTRSKHSFISWLLPETKSVI